MRRCLSRLTCEGLLECIGGNRGQRPQGCLHEHLGLNLRQGLVWQTDLVELSANL